MNTIPNIRAWDGKRMRHAEVDRIHSIARLSVAVDVETMIALENSDVPLHELELSWGSELYDKHETEFFTGDRVSHNDSHGTIVFEAGAFMIDFGNLSQLLYGLHLDYVVTENIYANKP